MAMHSLLISDLHLHPERRAIARRFFHFLSLTAPGAQALYILGDLFDAWIGDDDLVDPFHAEIAGALKQLTERGTPVFLMQGNRDVLLGETFAAACGARLLPERLLLDLHGAPTLLMHGDVLCSDDDAYQTFRAEVRSPEWQARFLAHPLSARREQVAELRRRSEAAKRGKSETIMDVNAETVARTLREAGYPRLVHGHTHRPGLYLHEVDGRQCERWVIADWRDDRVEYLRCDAQGCKAVVLE